MCSLHNQFIIELHLVPKHMKCGSSFKWTLLGRRQIAKVELTHGCWLLHSFGALPSAKEIRPRTNLLLSQAYYRLSKGKIHKLPTYACAAKFLLQSFKILFNKKENHNTYRIVNFELSFSGVLLRRQILNANYHVKCQSVMKT